MRVDSVPSVIDALERAPEIVVPLVREVPATFLKRRPASGRWSAHEHACHLAAVHGLFFKRLDQMLISPAPVITPYDPGTQDPDGALLSRDLDESLDAFVQDRVRLVGRFMSRHLALHDFLHACRIEELLLKREWMGEWLGQEPS